VKIYVYGFFFEENFCYIIVIFSSQEIKKYYCPSKMQESLCSFKSSPFAIEIASLTILFSGQLLLVHKEMFLMIQRISTW